MKTVGENEALIMNDVKKMSNAELVELALNGSKSQKSVAMAELVEKNSPLITHFAKKYYYSYISTYMEDMLQEGRLAIYEHCLDYDASRGQFSTFISRYIIEALKNYICQIHGITPHYFNRIKKVRQSIEHLQAEGIENPDYGAISEDMNVGVTAIQRAFRMANNLNHFSLDSDDWGLGKDELTISPEDIVEDKDTREAVHRAINRLSAREAKVITAMYFGDSVNSKKSDKIVPAPEVAAQLGMSTTEVRRLANMAIRHLKDSKELRAYDMKESERRMAINDYANNLYVEFTSDDDVIEAELNFALTLDDVEDLVM